MTKKNESISEIIIDNIINKHNDDTNHKNYINVSHLAKICDIPTSTLWFYLKSRRKWPADQFLKVLIELNYAHVVDGYLMIDLTEVPQSSIKKLISRKRG
jgi:hypothetical protein